MKSPHFPASPCHCIEPLEARIAPARIIITGVPSGAIGGSSDTDYNEAPFVNTELAVGVSDGIAQAVGGGVPNVADTFYLRLSKGDVLKVYNSVNGPEAYLKVTAGNVVAFFVDRDLDNEVDANELVSLSLGKGAGVVVNGGLEGSIVTNLNENGTARLSDDFLDMTAGVSGLVSSQQGITKLRIGAGVAGSILAGGNVTNVKVAGAVDSILVGAAANGAPFDLLPGVVGGDGTISFSQNDGVVGASISNVTVKEVVKIGASDGGVGAAGGSLSYIRIDEDSNGLILKAGDGGGANTTTYRSGGMGGGLSQIYMNGAVDAVANDLIVFQAGSGGDSINGRGGLGGSVVSSYVGYQLVGTARLASQLIVADNVLMRAGAGGDGKIGGQGGSIAKSRVLVSTPNVDGEEVALIAGVGGSNLNSTSGVTGAGGSISHVTIQNSSPAGETGILLMGGDGGNSAGLAAGAAGGSVSGAKLLGANFKVLAGNGSAGENGGAGGSLSKISILESANVISRNAIFNAGFGGDGQVNGGAGGVISGLLVRNGDFTELTINGGASANGGSGRNGTGGRGGSVKDVDITDGSLSLATNGNLKLRTGQGGSGFVAGGAGGNMSRTSLVSTDMAVDVQTGDGGNAINPADLSASGKGGNGGKIKFMQVLAEGVYNLTPVSGTVEAGHGGDGVQGGFGGMVKGLSMRVEGDGALFAGDGGNGTTKAAGNGGAVYTSVLYATFGTGQLIAGDAGPAGGQPAAGGRIIGNPGSLIGLYSANDLTIRAGNGSNGGDGGSIRYVGYGSTSTTLVPTPNGNVLIQGGNGSDGASIGGFGGSVRNVSGSVSSKLGSTTKIIAGNGGSSPGFGAAGGSVANLVIERGGGEGIELRVTAGDAGDGPGAKVGGTGGSVSNVSVSNLEEGTVFRNVGAGDGGIGKRGGQGGSISGVRVLGHDIGVRYGADFGYDSMGGVFAGLGGVGSKSNGLAGNVYNVSADAIAAIVAGKALVPEAANVVAYVTVNGGNLLTESRGALLTGFVGGALVFTFNGETTGPIPPDSNAQAVQLALNLLPSITTAGGVTVTGNVTDGFDVTFVATGDKLPISGSEVFDVPSNTIVDGSFPIAVTEDRQGDNFPVLQEVQSFIVDPTAKFSVGFTYITGGPADITDQTGPLDPTITAAGLATELNNLASIAAAGGVNVAQDSVTKKFIVTFNTPFNSETLEVTGLRNEVQRVDFYGTGTFTLSFLGQTTVPIAYNATALQVAAALNDLSTIKALDGLNTGSVTVTALPNSAYDITFNVVGDMDDLLAVQAVAMDATTTADGTAGTVEVQKLKVFNTVTFNPVNLAEGNFVGAIADPQAFDGPTFKLVTDLNNNGLFDPGDQPRDGLIFCHQLIQATLNFTPEARMVDGLAGVPVFYDFKNRL